MLSLCRQTDSCSDGRTTVKQYATDLSIRGHRNKCQHVMSIFDMLSANVLKNSRLFQFWCSLHNAKCKIQIAYLSKLKVLADSKLSVIHKLTVVSRMEEKQCGDKREKLFTSMCSFSNNVFKSPHSYVNPLPDMPILGSSNSAANKEDIMSNI